MSSVSIANSKSLRNKFGALPDVCNISGTFMIKSPVPRLRRVAQHVIFGPSARTSLFPSTGPARTSSMVDSSSSPQTLIPSSTQQHSRSMASSSTEERTLLQERTPSGDTKPPLSPSFLTALPPDLLEKTDAFCFDCDGVIWRATELCDDRIPNVLNQLRALKKKIFFVTNNTTKAIAVYLDKLRSMGIEATEDEMYSAGAAAVDFLRLRCPEVVSSAEKVASEKVFLIGGKGLMTEFRRGKVNFIGGPEDEEFQAKEAAFFANLDNDLFKNVEIDEDVSVVLCGYDAKINYFKIQYAQLCLNEKQRGKQCKFVATNCDAVAHVTPDQEWAGNGFIVGAIRGCTGREPIVVGKPSSLLIDLIVEKNNLRKDRLVMVGDRLDTDILFGLNNDMTTVMVLSGVTSAEQLLAEENTIRPHYYIDTVGAFFG